MPNPKLKFAFYWAASCGGCEVAVLDIDEAILKVVELADIVFWPVAMDYKYKDVQDMADGYIDVTFFNGAVRNSEQLHLARLLRKKSKILVAFGACATSGGIPGLANFYSAQEIRDYAYLQTPSTENKDKIMPQETSKVKEGEIETPKFFGRVYALDQVVEVDYYIPGCPPIPDQIVDAVLKIATDPPEKKHVFAGDKTLCDTCPLPKQDKKISKIYRPHQIIPEPGKCLLEQGIICLGPVTRSGCGNRCINVNMPCRGCFGASPNIVDDGGKFVSALASILDVNDEKTAQEIVDTIVDPAGTFYRFDLPKSLLHGNIHKIAEEDLK
jgi:F420-non-reducing hydrogenase small subunit